MRAQHRSESCFTARRAAHATAMALLLGLSSLAVGAANPAPASGQVSSHPGKSDELLIVDCLLPGQVRRLGSRLTMLTARRALKTSARDCEIRGGEYAAYDRANYDTARKVWQPLAEQ